MWAANWYLASGGGLILTGNVTVEVFAMPDVEIAEAVDVEISTPAIEVEVADAIDVEIGT